MAEPTSLKGCAPWLRKTSYFTRNEQLQADFRLFLAQDAGRVDPALLTRLLAEAKELHNKQWSEHLHNVLDKGVQCPNDCLYCYMKDFKGRVLKVVARPLPDVEDAALLSAGATKRWARVGSDDRRHVIMYPTSHDIFPRILPAYIEQARRMLAAGHAVLLVSKPRLDCLTAVAAALEEYKDRVVYRLTIGSDRQEVLDFWEPHAPQFAERLAVLRMLRGRGCVTSVSIEPYLSDPRATVAAVAPFVSETIWIGPMSGFKGAAKDREAAWRASPPGSGAVPLEALMSPDYVRGFVRDLAGNPQIYWKTAVIRQLAKAAQVRGGRKRLAAPGPAGK
jgi:hypothetical protein